MIKLSCKNCKKEYTRVPSLVDGSKFCTMDCKWAYNGWTSKANVTCGGCGKQFRVKPSKLAKMKHKPCCSRECLAKYRSGVYSGRKNPNYKGKGVDSDGYRVHVPYAAGFPKDMQEKKLHRAVAAREIGVIKIVGFHVHHRDCDVLNNEVGNLAILNPSDHKWIHKQFGNATLWAMMNGKIDINEMSDWSDDSGRARRILSTRVDRQEAGGIGYIDGDKLYKNKDFGSSGA